MIKVLSQIYAYSLSIKKFEGNLFFLEENLPNDIINGSLSENEEYFEYLVLYINEVILQLKVNTVS